MIVNHVMSDDSINVITDTGQPQTVTRKDPKFQEIYDALERGDFDEAEALMSPASYVNAKGMGRFEVRNGKAYVDGKDLPEALSNRLVQFSKNDLDLKPLLNFWDKLTKNPSHRAVNELYGFLEHSHVPIAEDGDFLAYKRVSEDYTDLRTGKFDNSPGSTVEMPRHEVDDDPKNTCSAGLHVAGFKYAATNYGIYGDLDANSDRLILVKINPEDVVCIPYDYDFTKMRVCRYVVDREVEHEFKDEVYVSVFGVYVDDCDDDYDDDGYLDHDDNDPSCATSMSVDRLEKKEVGSDGRLLVSKDNLVQAGVINEDETEFHVSFCSNKGTGEIMVIRSKELPKYDSFDNYQKKHLVRSSDSLRIPKSFLTSNIGTKSVFNINAVEEGDKSYILIN